MGHHPAVIGSVGEAGGAEEVGGVGKGPVAEGGGIDFDVDGEVGELVEVLGLGVEDGAVGAADFRMSVGLMV